MLIVVSGVQMEGATTGPVFPWEWITWVGLRSLFYSRSSRSNSIKFSKNEERSKRAIPPKILQTQNR